jgi:hypothetical protein
MINTNSQFDKITFTLPKNVIEYLRSNTSNMSRYASEAISEKMRRDALARLSNLGERVKGRHPQLSEEEALDLADRFARDVLDDMVNEGKVAFEHK